MIGGSSPVDQESMGAFQEFPQVHVCAVMKCNNVVNCNTCHEL